MATSTRFVSVLCGLLIGCGSSGSGANTHSVKVDGITISAVQAPGEHVFKGDTMGSYTKQTDTITGLDFMLKDRELTVNGKKYGKLAQGDVVLIQDGKVMVNGSERMPE